MYERIKLAGAYNEAVEYGQVLDYMANKIGNKLY